MEEEIGQGQLEELILHARDELSLIPKMAGGWSRGLMAPQRQSLSLSLSLRRQN